MSRTWKNIMIDFSGQIFLRSKNIDEVKIGGVEK
jgi:hypothetical protein